MEVFRGKVVHGQGRGHGMQTPTLNLDVKSSGLVHGVYAVWAFVNDQRFRAAMNWGPRPSFDEANPVVELHLLDAEGDFYGCEVEVQPMKRLRDVRAFDSKEDLMRQIEKDIEETRSILGGEAL